jgi:methylaspartate ammonia-lyase
MDHLVRASLLNMLRLSTSLIALALSVNSVVATVPIYGQCGGINYTGDTGKFLHLIIIPHGH